MMRRHVNLLSAEHRNLKYRYMHKLILKVALVFLVILPGASPKALTEKGGNGLNNRLMLNGKVTDETALSSAITGKLSMVSLHTGTGESRLVPFYAYLIREEKIVDADAFAHNNAVTEIEMSDILKSAKEGDRIIIDPAEEKTAEKRRVIMVRQRRYTPQFNLWPGQIAVQKDGC